MSQAWNRQLQNINRLMNEYAKELALKEQGFQLGESGPLRTGKTVPTVYQQPQAQALLTGNKTPLLTTSGKPLPTPVNTITDFAGKQAGYVLPNGQVTSNPELVNVAKQQVLKSQLLKDAAALKGAAKAGGITGALTIPASILTHKDAYKYYDDMVKDKSLDGEKRQLAAAMRTKEALAMLTEGPGAAIGAGIGSRFGKVGTTVGGAALPVLGSLAGKGMDWALQPAMDKYGFQKYEGGLDLSNIKVGNGKSGNGKTAKKLLEDAAKDKQQGSQSAGTVTGGGAAVTPQSVQQVVDPLLAQQTEEDQLRKQQANAEIMNQYIQQMQDINRPYIDALNNYYKNYDEMLKRNQAYKRYWQGISSITGNPNWAKIADAYNPLTNEANRVATVKQLQDARSADANAINEALGNLAAVQEMDMDPMTSFANKNLLTMMTANNKRLTDWEKAQLMADTRRYGFDIGYKKALEQQALRNAGSANVARINAAAYGMNPGVGLNPYGQAQQQALNNLY